jgi:predicted transposase/invertase (TIGR01784 family)
LNYQLDKAEAKGLAKGEKNKAIEIARNLLSQNIDLQTISSATGLSTDELEKLRKEPPIL